MRYAILGALRGVVALDLSVGSTRAGDRTVQCVTFGRYPGGTLTILSKLAGEPRIAGT